MAEWYDIIDMTREVHKLLDMTVVDERSGGWHISLYQL